MEKIKISVRNLVEFILRSGDIDNRRGQSTPKDAMQEGSRLHRKIQNSMPSTYQPEVTLRYNIEYEHYELVVEGRADGIITEEDGITIDEIKTTYADLEKMDKPFEIHVAQAKCYAYIYGKQNCIDAIKVQMTYCNVDSEEIKRFVQSYTFMELEEWFDKLVKEYKKWADFQYLWKKQRQSSIWDLPFPFEYRNGQKELAGDVYRTINRQKTLFIQAPTGVGKTVTTIYPAVMAVGQGLADKIFYLTAKSITGTVAQDTFNILKEKGYRAKVLSITAKEKMCLCESKECNPVDCKYAKGHFDRVNDAVFELLNNEDEMTRDVLIAQAEKWTVCPFEMSLDASLWADNIICDYNYVFDPNVYLKRFFGDGIKGDYIFLVDEAHNLVERGRGMYSAELYKEDFLAMKKIMKKYSKSVEKALDRCNSTMLTYKRECEEYREYESIGNFYYELMRLGGAIEKFFESGIQVAEKKEFNEFYFALRHFMNMYDILDEHYVIYTQHEEDGRFKIKLYCVDPSQNIQNCINKANSVIFFSATFLPINYYKSLLSTRKDNYAVYAETAFTPEQSLITIARDVSTKYTRRNTEEYIRIASYIKQVVDAKQGNYMIFFPSYKMLQDIQEKYEQIAESDYDIISQNSDMSEQERNEFLERFAEKKKNILAFCVLGGIFGEGIDLKGEKLIGSIIVGNGMPQISYEQEILKNYYDDKCGQGFDYAFRYPGMNKVLQAAGRVIRTQQDRGVIILLEERFLNREYRDMFPREWARYKTCNRVQLEEQLKQFWKN